MLTKQTVDSSGNFFHDWNPGRRTMTLFHIFDSVSLFRFIDGSGGNCCLSIWSGARCKVHADSDLYRNGIRAKIGRT